MEKKTKKTAKKKAGKKPAKKKSPKFNYSEHICVYCGVLTDQPDDTCYKAPWNVAKKMSFFNKIKTFLGI